MITPTPSPSPRDKAIVIGLIILGLLVTALFTLRALHSWKRLQQMRHEPQRTDVSEIRGWMTISFIAHAYSIPEPFLFTELNIPPAGNERQTLRELADAYYNGDDTLFIQQVQAAVQRFQASPPSPPESSPPLFPPLPRP